MWQDTAIQNLVALLQPDEDVRAVALSGSCSLSPTERDVWSDVDLLIVVNEHALRRYFPALDWLQEFGEIYAYEQNNNPLTSTTRVCFSDFRRLDIVLTTESALEQIDSWSFVSFWNGAHSLFSRSTLVDAILARSFEPPKPSPLSAAAFRAMANRFWFKAALAVTKVVRDDLLIALHLALDLVRDCCVLAMLLRDRAAGTNYHRHGGIGNDFVAELQPANGSYEAVGILDIIEQSGIKFDSFAAQWAGEYLENRQPLLAAINRARQDLGT